VLSLLNLAMACAPEAMPPAAGESGWHDASPTNSPSCAPPHRTGTLPGELHEASGIAASRQYPGVLWTHNDSGNPTILFAIDSTGKVIERVRVRDATSRDWEDIALGPCPAGECIYLADTGDNRLNRRDPAIYRIPEPAPGDTLSAPAERFPLRLPNGPRDIEALYLLPDTTIYLVSKGRKHAIELFRYPPPLRTDEAVRLEEVQRLSERGVALPFQVTGAGATPAGDWVAIRTYSAVQIYRTSTTGHLLPALPAPGISLQPIAEPQGEGVDIRADGTLLLSSEAGPAGVPGIIAMLDCRLPPD
jgi:hypothetical protein